MYPVYSRPFYFVLAAIMLSLALAGCGGREEPTPTSAPPTATTVPVPVGDVAAGEKIYQTTCIACHGPDAKGVQGLGKSLHISDSEFVRTKTDDELVEYIKVGRRPDDPLNTTGIDMPPKGGNPAMSEQDMYDVVAYLRTLE